MTLFFQFLLLFFFFLIYLVGVGMCMCHRRDPEVRGHLSEMVLCFYHAGLQNQTEAIRPGSPHLLSLLTGLDSDNS